MADLTFECVGAAPVAFAAGPTLRFTIRVSERGGTPVHALALRCQFRVEPLRRRYDDEEAERVADLFGSRERWADTAKPMQLATIGVIVPTFAETADVAVDVPCTYDMEVATTKYFHSLRGGEIPLLVLFSGTVFTKGDRGFEVEQVPWHNEASYRLPVSEWQAMMDDAFPNTGWLRLRRDSIDALRSYATTHAIPTSDQLVERLLKEAGWPPA